MANIIRAKRNPRGQVQIALGRRLYDAIRAIAKAERRSINEQVVTALDEWYKVRTDSKARQ